MGQPQGEGAILQPCLTSGKRSRPSRSRPCDHNHGGGAPEHVHPHADHGERAETLEGRRDAPRPDAERARPHGDRDRACHSCEHGQGRGDIFIGLATHKPRACDPRGADSGDPRARRRARLRWITGCIPPERWLTPTWYRLWYPDPHSRLLQAKRPATKRGSTERCHP